MKIKVSEATELQLDWLVAKCEGWTVWDNDPIDGKVFRKSPHGFRVDWRVDDNSFSNDWGQGGPIIEREEEMQFWKWGGEPRDEMQCACLPVREAGLTRRTTYFGKTKLIAAMRCWVASKLGEEVDVPDELTLQSEVLK